MRSVLQNVLCLLLMCALVTPGILAETSSSDRSEPTGDDGSTDNGNKTDGAGGGTSEDEAGPDTHEDPYAEPDRHEDPYRDPYGETYDGYDEGSAQHNDACRQAKADFDGQIRAIDERFYAQERQLKQEWRAWDYDNHTAEENDAHDREMEARYDALKEREHQAHAEAERELHARCEAAHGSQAEPRDVHQGPARHDQREPEPYRPGPGMDRCDDPDLRHQFEARMQANAEEFRSEHEAKWAAHEREMEARWQAFEDEGNHTQEELDAFHAEMDAAFAAFEARMEAQRDAFETRMDAEAGRFFAKLESQCDQDPARFDDHERYGERPMAHDERGPRDMPPELRAAFEELEMARMECESRAFADADGDEQAFWDAMRDCERRMRALYDEQVGKQMDDRDAHERMGSWRMSEDETTVRLEGTYVTLGGDPTTNTLYDLSVAGVVFIEDLATDGYLERFDMDDRGDASTLTAEGEGLKLRLHDNPSGLIRFQADGDHGFLLGIPEGFYVVEADAGYRIAGAGSEALVRVAHGDAEWDEATRTLELRGEAVFLVPGAENQVLGNVANKHRSELSEAVEKRKLGAEITLVKDDQGETRDDTLVFDDVEVEVADDADDGAVEVTVSSHTLTEGKTFVLNVDSEVLAVGGTLDVTYFDIDEETGEETPSAIQQASSLADILDATDDETAEYWIVADADGVQVMASVPHWSIHKIRVQSGDVAEDPEGLFGAIPAPPVAALLVALVAAAYVAARRR